MKSDFARDLSDVDRPIRDALKDRPGKPVKLRIQPMILFAKQYQAWKDVRWTLDCDTPEEAFAVRDALRAFFTHLTTHGPEAVHQALAGMPAAAVEGSERVA